MAAMASIVAFEEMAPCYALLPALLPVRSSGSPRVTHLRRSAVCCSARAIAGV